MIDTTTLQLQVDGYRENCLKAHRKPSFRGFATTLGISRSTVANVVHGAYNGGYTYTDKPHPTRCIGNSDFELIRGLFV